MTIKNFCKLTVVILFCFFPVGLFALMVNNLAIAYTCFAVFSLAFVAVIGVSVNK